MVLRIFLLTLCVIQNLQALGSLMFSAQECERIQCDRHKKQLDEMLKSGRALKCEGILFNNSEDWTLWMNGQCVSAKSPTALKSWTVQKVTAQEVQGVFKVGSQSYPLLLKPGQSFFVPEQPGAGLSTN